MPYSQTANSYAAMLEKKAARSEAANRSDNPSEARSYQEMLDKKAARALLQLSKGRGTRRKKSRRKRTTKKYKWW